MMMKRHTKCFVPLFFALSVVSCDETLPARVEPQEFLQADCRISPGVVVFLDTVSQGVAGAIDVRVKNLYSEVLQGSEFAQAEIEVWLRAAPEHRATVTMNRRDIQNQGVLYGQLITVSPGASVFFLKQWNHRTNQGQGFWEFVHLTPRVNDRGEPYLESDPVALAATGKVQLFKNVQAEKFPQISFSLVYRIFLPTERKGSTESWQ